MRLFAITALALSMFSCSSPESTREPEKKVTREHYWTTVQSISGSGTKASAPFHLDGGEALIHYSYTSLDPSIGVFSAYILPAGWDIQEKGGIPDVTLNQSTSADQESHLYKQAGDYYLMVNAAGEWTAEIQEKR